MDQTHINIINNERLAPLFPPLVEKVKLMILALEDEMDPILITQGLRTWDEQHTLYAQGRQGLDEVNALRKAVNWAPLQAQDNTRTVTNADAGTSFHNYGLAVDVVPITSAGQADWCDSHPDWQRIIAVAAAQGLEHGDRGYHDNPHFQLIGAGTTPQLLKTLYKPGDLSAVWAEVSRRL